MRLIKVFTFLVIAALGVSRAQTLPPATQYGVNLVWDVPVDNGDPVAGYFAFRALEGQSYSQLNETPVTVTNYSDASQLEYSSIYDYYVESVDAEGNASEPSNTASVSIRFVPYAPVLGAISSI